MNKKNAPVRVERSDHGVFLHFNLIDLRSDALRLIRETVFISPSSRTRISLPPFSLLEELRLFAKEGIYISFIFQDFQNQFANCIKFREKHLLDKKESDEFIKIFNKIELFMRKNWPMSDLKIKRFSKEIDKAVLESDVQGLKERWGF